MRQARSCGASVGSWLKCSGNLAPRTRCSIPETALRVLCISPLSRRHWLTDGIAVRPVVDITLDDGTLMLAIAVMVHNGAYGWFRATCYQLDGRVYEGVLDLLKEGSLARGGKRLFFGVDGSGTLAGSGILVGASDSGYVQNLPRVPMGSWLGSRYTSIQP